MITKRLSFGIAYDEVNDMFYVIGGQNDDGDMKKCECYDI